MKLRMLLGAALVVVLGIAAATAGASGQRHQANKLTVWLQTDAQSGWADVVAAATAQFQKDHPGWTVDVQYQSWGDHLQKFDATLAGGNSPDVIEMGNTEMTKYMAAGAFADISSFSFDNKGTWLSGLAKSGNYGGKTDAKRLAEKNKKKGFSPVYIAGTDWYVAMGFVYDYGGSIATTSKGKWVGTLNSTKSMQGLQAFKDFFLATSQASKTTDEAHPNPYDVYAQGQAASMIGPSWFSCCVGKFKGATTGQFVMPGHVKGQSLPGFLGGSDLAVPVSGNKAMGADWIKDFTSTSSEKALQAKGNIPNSTSLLGTSVNERAAQRSWFVPTAKHWVDVENGNILRNMLAQILTGKLTIQQAANSASDNIASVLNQA